MMKVKNLWISTLMIVLMAVTSCHVVDEPVNLPDDPWRTGLLGTWDRSFDEIGPITNPHEIDSFQFASDGTGYYACENSYGEWVNVPFRWRSYYGNYLEIYYLSGETATTFYYFYNGYLCFGDSSIYDGYALRY